MANTKTQTGNDWPTQPFNKLIEEDPQIVKVPLDGVEWGARRSTLNRIENRNGMNIKHIPNSGSKGK